MKNTIEKALQKQKEAKRAAQSLCALCVSKPSLASTSVDRQGTDHTSAQHGAQSAINHCKYRTAGSWLLAAGR